MNHRWDNTKKDDRFDPVEGRKTMKAVVTVGNGGYDKLECREVRRPVPKEGEELLQVLAAGINNTRPYCRGWPRSRRT